MYVCSLILDNDISKEIDKYFPMKVLYTKLKVRVHLKMQKSFLSYKRLLNIIYT